MTTFAHTTQTAGNAKRAIIGFVGKAAAAIFGMIAVFSVAQSSGAQAPTVAVDATQQSDLQGLLCRIDRRCPGTNLAAREAPGRARASAAAMDDTRQSDLQGLLCRIDRRCPTMNLAAREASRMQTAEITVR